MTPEITTSTGIVNMYGSMAQPIGSVRFQERECFAAVYHAGMTALASIYTIEGFAVGADSRRMDMHGQIVTEKAVKIHETRHSDFLGAYGFSGNIALEFTDGRMLDILDSAKSIASDLTGLHFSGAQDYVESFCSCLAAKIEAESSGIALPDKFQLRGMFTGYTGDHAVRVQMELSAVQGYLLRPRLTELVESPIDFCISSGSQVVWDEMSQKDRPETLAEAVPFVQQYIFRCISNTTDPYCAHIGGQAQIATVTSDGFKWVIRP
jgi:hypothetical protein